MGYYTTVKVINGNGDAVQAAVKCGGSNKGFTDSKTGEVSFEMKTKDSYSVVAKRSNESVSGNVHGGQCLVLRIK